MEDSTIKDALTTLADFLSKKDYAAAEKFWLNQSHAQTDYSYWHNLGMIYKLQGQYSQARFAFEKANHLSLYSSRTMEEINVVEEKLGFNQSSSDFFRLGELGASLGPYKVGGLCVILSAFLLAFLQKKLTLLQKTGILLLAFTPVAGAILYFQSTTAFVTIDPVPLYSGASQIYASGKFVPLGARLIGIPKGEWTAVHTSTGDTLWLKTEDVRKQSRFLWD